jgi:hypothetical protein
VGELLLKPYSTWLLIQTFPLLLALVALALTIKAAVAAQMVQTPYLALSLQLEAVLVVE